MKIVVDTNRIIASLIKEGISRKIIMNRNFEFLSPDYSLAEIYKYEDEICKKAKITSDEFEILLSILFERINIIPLEEYGNFLDEGGKLIEDIKDIPFISVCLSYNAEGIWSDDPHFLKQDKIKIFQTKDMISMI